jgi:hypothetical protein
MHAPAQELFQVEWLEQLGRDHAARANMSGAPAEVKATARNVWDRKEKAHEAYIMDRVAEACAVVRLVRGIRALVWGYYGKVEKDVWGGRLDVEAEVEVDALDPNRPVAGERETRVAQEKQDQLRAQTRERKERKRKETIMRDVLVVCPFVGAHARVESVIRRCL